MQNLSLAHSHVQACIFSDSDFDLHCETVFQEASKNSKQYLQDFITSISYALTSRTSTPLQQSLALQLLLNTSETNNRALMKTLAASKDFLNKLFHDSQFDRDESLDSKGTTFFSDSPSAEVARLGKKYIRMVLEAFVYWDSQYGVSNPWDPLHCYYAVFDALNKQTTVPTSYRYVGQNTKVQKYVAKMGIKHSNGNQEIRITEKMKANEARWQLMRCVQSEDNYNNYSSVIFESVDRPSLNYNENLLQAITEVLQKPTYKTMLKFYSVFLLAQLSETRDKTLKAQIVRESNLLNEIYKQAKKSDSRDGRVSKDTNEETIYKRKLNDVTVELVKFWHLEFGSNNIKSPFYGFTYLYNNLHKIVEFPEDFYYIKSSLKAPITKLDTSVKNKGNADEDGESIMRLVRQYILSGLAFREDYASIPSILLKQTKNKSAQYIKGTHEILTSTQVRPSAKFYALFLLLKVIESRNNIFISALTESKELLDQMVEDAEFDRNRIPEKRGEKFFSSNPSPEEAIIGCNYIQLLHETIRFLGRNYQVDNRRNPNYVFKGMMEQTSARMPEEDYYVGKDLDAVEEKIMKRFETIPFTQLPSINVMPKSVINETVAPRVEAKEKVFSSYDLQKSLDKLSHSKTVLFQFLEDYKTENMENLDLLDMVVQEVNDNYKKEVHPHLQSLMESSAPDAENYKNIIYYEGKVINEIDQELLNYKTQKISYFELRHRLLALLSAEPPIPFPAHHIATQNRQSFEGSGLRVGTRLIESEPGPKYARTPIRAINDGHPVSASETVYARRLEGFGRSQRKANTVHIETSGLFRMNSIPLSSSIVERPLERRNEKPKEALREFEKIGKEIDEKIKAVEIMSASMQVPGRRESAELSSGSNSATNSELYRPYQAPIGSSYISEQGYLGGERSGLGERSYISPFLADVGVGGRFESERRSNSSYQASKLGENGLYENRKSYDGRNYLNGLNAGGRLNL